MKYIRTKYGHILKIRSKQQRPNGEYDTWYVGNNVSLLYNHDHNTIAKEADSIEELCDEIVLIENGNEHNIVYLQEGYDRIIEYHKEGNYEPRLIGRIKVDLDKKAIAEWKENKQGLYDWVLL